MPTVSPLFSALVVRCNTAHVEEDRVLCSEPGFEWYQQSFDGQEEEESWEDGQRTSVRCRLYRDGILLLPWPMRWAFIVRQCEADEMFAELHNAVSNDPAVDLSECIQLV